MARNPIETLKRAVNDANYVKLNELLVVILHAGPKGNIMEIDGADITKVDDAGFDYKSENGEIVRIPKEKIVTVMAKLNA